MGYRKLIQSGNLIETYEYKLDNIPRRANQRKREKNRSHIASRNRRPDNLYRLKGRFTRLIRSNLYGSEAPLFVTLTMYETVSVRRAYRSFSRFVQRLRARYGKAFKYVAVPEFQGNVYSRTGELKEYGGAVHFHALFWFLPITPQKERSRRILQWAWRRGYVDCIQTDGSVKLAGYLGKYLFKAMHDERIGYQKAYVASRNVLRPVQVSYASAFQYLSEIVGGITPSVVRQFETQWLGTCKYTRYLL